jgi:alpha-amylase/alpha-mannosidase (GH57 family)
MPKIYLCFLWHMHQPFYKDLMSGEYRMPWTRLHALKDYYGMVKVLEEFPEVRQTFNLVPSMMLQVEEYAAGKAVDPALRVALKAAEMLTDEEQEFILRNFLYANPPRMVTRFPRYAEFCEAWRAADRKAERAKRLFTPAAFRDLQVLSQLAWFDEEFLTKDPEVRELVRRGRDYTVDDQALIARKEAEILARVIPVYRTFAERGQIEVSTTPFYHPILPLICDSNIAEVPHPGVPLPTRFRYPADARTQLERARTFCNERFGAAPAGLWPSEGSVSDEALGIAAETGFRWAATDNGVLSRTLGRTAGIDETYRPYVWRHDGREMGMVFRDHYLSDLIGFVYSRIGSGEAARDFLDRIRDNCRGILASGRDALVPIILDGENAWEFYEENGRPFFRELYRGITADPRIEALTMTEALKRVEPRPLGDIFPGSWINANFDIWIGAEEDNRAWEYLLRARRTYDRVTASGSKISEAARALAFEELLIAEGSDWCWWYGPEHQSDFRSEFDELFRSHLANVYRALGLTPPEELSRSILRVAVRAVQSPPTGPIRAVIDGEVTSYFEWLGAGVYRVDKRSGAMHGKRFLITELFYGSDGQSLFVRVDFEPTAAPSLSGMEAHITITPGGSAVENFLALRFANGRLEPQETRLLGPAKEDSLEYAFHKVLEMRLPLATLGVAYGNSLRLQFSLWKDGLPVDAVPQENWLEISTADPAEWPV